MGYIFCKIWTVSFSLTSISIEITMPFFFFLLWNLRWKNNFFERCRHVCVSSPSGRKGFKHKSSQQPGQQLPCRDATHWKLKKTWSHTHIPAWKKPNKKAKALNLPWESSFSSCHSESLPRRRRCHLDCWGLREGWPWMVSQSHPGSVSVCPAVWNSAAPSFAGKTWAWKATGNGGEGINDHRTSWVFTPLLTLHISKSSHSTQLSKQPESAHRFVHMQETCAAARLHLGQQFNHPNSFQNRTQAQGLAKKVLLQCGKKSRRIWVIQRLGL